MKKMITTCVAVSILLSNNAHAKFDFSKTPETLSTYYVSPLQELNIVKNKLLNHGFEILSTDEILLGEYIITITNDELKATNSYMATLHILVNNITKEIRVQNPSYLGAAYLQEAYKYGQFKKTLMALEKSLGEINEVEEKLDFSDLASYKFMFGMPQLEDTISLMKVSTLENRVNSKSILYSLKLSNGTTLIGHKLTKRTSKFLKKIGQENNALLLPYESMIKNGEATTLNPKYYLALSMPLLSMGEFMKIVTAPDQIIKDLKKSYQ